MKMTMKEKLEMHKQIEQEDQEARERFNEIEHGSIGLRYNADNMPLTFQKGDRLYLRKRKFGANGDIIVIKLPSGYHVCRMYLNPEGGYTLVDEKNPPMLLTEFDLIGTVTGYERIF